MEERSVNIKSGRKWYKRKIYWAIAAILILFIAGVFSTNGMPTFRNLPKRVNNPSILLEGYGVEKGADVKIFLNNNLVAEVKADEKGNFQAALDLKEGENILYAEATYKGKIKKGVKEKLTFAIEIPVEAKQGELDVQDEVQKVFTEVSKIEIAGREEYFNPTFESFSKAAKLLKAEMNVAAEMANPDYQVKIYLKSDGITIDAEKMKKSYGLDDLNAIKEAMNDKEVIMSKELLLKIIVPDEISENEFKSEAEKLVKAEYAKDMDIDKIFISAYLSKEAIAMQDIIVASAIWGPKDLIISERIAKENNRAGYEVQWKHISSGVFQPKQSTEEREREIYFSYWDVLQEYKKLSFEQQSVKAREKVAAKFGISPDEVGGISDKVLDSIPTDEEIKISNALWERFEKYRVGYNSLPRNVEDKATSEIAKTFNISVNRLTAIDAHVTHWKIKK